MLDLRPVGYVIGLLVAILGATMAVPMLMDILEGRGQWPVFLECGVVTVLIGGLVARSCENWNRRDGLTIQQTFLLTTTVWLALPVFGALPFMVGETSLNFIFVNRPSSANSYRVTSARSFDPRCKTRS